MHQIFASFIELENVVAGVSVGQKNVAVWSDRDGRRIELGQFQAGLFRELQTQDNIAHFRAEFDAFCIGVTSPVDKFTISFVTNLHVVDVGVIFANESTNDFPVRAEYKHAHVSAGVDVASFVDHDAAVSRPDD